MYGQYVFFSRNTAPLLFCWSAAFLYIADVSYIRGSAVIEAG